MRLSAILKLIDWEVNRLVFLNVLCTVLIIAGVLLMAYMEYHSFSKWNRYDK